MAGFRAATGSILVTIDSDSEIEARTIDEMVAPFLADPDVGAVAGRVAVLNRDTTISRMLEVQYALAFDFGRAAQSTYRCVACCPGALSAFRREAVLPFLDEWANQTFLGRPVNHGEDQALTNIVLRQGYDTVYQRNAIVWTLWRFDRDGSHAVKGLSGYPTCAAAADDAAAICVEQGRRTTHLWRAERNAIVDLGTLSRRYDRATASDGGTVVASSYRGHAVAVVDAMRRRGVRTSLPVRDYSWVREISASDSTVVALLSTQQGMRIAVYRIQ